VPLNRITTTDILSVTDALKELPSEQLHCHRARTPTKYQALSCPRRSCRIRMKLR
jgi:hypothetical protein